MRFINKLILPIMVSASSLLVVVEYYFHKVILKQRKAIICATDRLKKNINNYEVNNYIHKIETLNKAANKGGSSDTLIEGYNLVKANKKIDLILKIRLKLELKSRGINVE